MPLMGFFKSLSCLYSWKAWLMPRSRASSRCGTWIPTTITPAGPSPPRTGTTAWIMSPLSSSWTVVISWPASAWRMCSRFVSRNAMAPRPGFLTCASSCPCGSRR